MTTIEVACAGLALALVLTIGLKRTKLAWRWPLILVALSTLYFALAPARDHRQWIVLVLTLFWCGHHVYWTRKLQLASLDSVTEPNGAWATLREALTLFFVSAPMLVTEMEPDPFWSWSDFLAIAVFCSGMFLSFAKRFRHPAFAAECAMAWSFYGLALAVPNGLVTLFAPLLLLGPLKRSYGLSATPEPEGRGA